MRNQNIRKLRIFFATAAVISLFGLLIVLNSRGASNGAAKISETINVDNGDLKINWDRYPTTDVELTESLEITESGTYHLTGNLEGMITVDAGEGKVRLILDGVTIKNSAGPAISCFAADDLVIELVGENYLEDGTVYDTSFDEDVTGAIYSKADLTFQGDGVLNLVANYQDGIVGKDDLKFNAGVYNIKSADDGIRGKDSVYVVAGDFTIESSADGIKSTNEDTAGKGFILIENGTFRMLANGKGIKATNSILIQNGDFFITSYDDSIHSNNYVGIMNGSFSLSAGDDGVHADRELIIEDGTIDLVKSYEGLEAQVVTINGGKISIVSSDDGINAGGGADNSSTGRAGANAFAADESCVLTINGGELKINASGDGVDSNGALYFNGGKVEINGPTNNGNGALDSGLGITMNGGEVIAVGASGMAETLGESSSIYNISVYFSEFQAAKTKIEIKNSANETIVAFTSAKTFNHLAAGSEEFKNGETYTIYINDEKYESFTISSKVTTIGTNSSNMGPGGTPGNMSPGRR